MFNVRYFAPNGNETSLSAVSYEISPARDSVKVWSSFDKSLPPAAQWSGTPRDGTSPGDAMVLISNKFASPLETIYLLIAS